jgi:hypothetical protein
LVLQSRTRAQLRVSIGYNLGALYVSSTSSAVSGGNAKTHIVDNTLQGGDDEYNGGWIIATSGSNSGEIRRVSDYTSSTTDITVSPPFSSNVPSSMTYELWDDRFMPTAVHDFMNQAIINATGLFYDPVEDSTSLFADRHTSRFDLPTTLSMIRRIETRKRVSSVLVHDMDSEFDETTDTDVSQTLDDEDKKQGGYSLKLSYGSGVDANDTVTDSIASTDISSMTHLEGWVKSENALASGDIHVLLDNTASCASPVETLNIGAVTAETWTRFKVALANPWDDTAIISVGLRYTTNVAEGEVWFDDFIAVDNNSAVWMPLSSHQWYVDQEARDLVLTQGGKDAAGYKALKLIGGDKPALLSSDSSTTEVDDQYIISYASAMSFAAASGGPATDPDALRNQAGFWFGMSQQRLKAFPLLENVRSIS